MTLWAGHIAMATYFLGQRRHSTSRHYSLVELTSYMQRSRQSPTPAIATRHLLIGDGLVDGVRPSIACAAVSGPA